MFEYGYDCCLVRERRELAEILGTSFTDMTMKSEE